LRYRPVEADTGAIGGSRSHEFQVLADSGEDAIVSCDRCDYAANVEKAAIGDASDGASAGGRAPASAGATTPLTRVPTPGKRSVDEVAEFLRVPMDRFVKTLLYTIDGGDTVAALVRGDHALSEAKLKDTLGAPAVALASEAEVERVTGAPVGFAGPVGLRVPIRVIADRALVDITDAVAGANALDSHVTGVAHRRDFPDAT